MAADQALHGLDNLETETAVPGGSTARRIAARIWATTWPKALAIILVLVVWQIVYASGFKQPLFPGPGPTLSNLWHQMQHGQLWAAITITMRRAFLGYVVALLIGTAVGVVVARIPPLRAAVGSIISALLTMPSIAWYPFAIILFGLSTSTIVFVMALGAAPSIANGLINGIDYTPPLLLRAGKTMGLRGIALYRHLILPASLPSYVAGLKQGWAFAWRSLLAGELLVFIVGQTSLGQLLNDDQQALDTISATALMIVLLAIGVVVDMVFTKADLSIRRRRGLLDSAGA